MEEAFANGGYHTDEEVQNSTRNWLSDVGRGFYSSGIEKFVSRYDKCLNKLDYFVYYGQWEAKQRNTIEN